MGVVLAIWNFNPRPSSLRSNVSELPDSLELIGMEDPVLGTEYESNASSLVSSVAVSAQLTGAKDPGSTDCEKRREGMRDTQVVVVASLYRNGPLRSYRGAVLFNTELGHDPNSGSGTAESGSPAPNSGRMAAEPSPLARDSGLRIDESGSAAANSGPATADFSPTAGDSGPERPEDWRPGPAPGTLRG
jgi:hypothetical protein